MKNKILCAVLVLVMVCSSLFVLVACKPGNEVDNTILKEQVTAAQKMTTEELLEEAKKETGDFIAYGNTSRITKAMSNFIASEYGKALGLTDKNATAKKMGDNDIFTTLNSEKDAASKAKNASMVLIQDSAKLSTYRATTEIVTNYIPKGMEASVDQNNLVPLAHQFINKLFMYNVSDKNDTAQFSNVWELTKPEYKGKIYFKSPEKEAVNLNFLIMLTSDEWAGKLETAYKKLNGSEATDVGAGKTYKNYGYKWIAEFVSNCNFTISSDTTIASTLSKPENKGLMGLFVLSKLRDSSVYGDNLQVSAWDKDGDNYVKIEPFAGFMYSIYAQVASYGPRPYTAMLFINYLMTEEGFTPWKSLGGYSANKDVPIYEGGLTKPETTADGKEIYTDNNGKKMYLSGKDGDAKVYTYIDGGTTIKSTDKITVDGAEVELTATLCTVTVTTIKDSPLSFWMENLVVEDGAYINQAGKDVEDWIIAKVKG